MVDNGFALGHTDSFLIFFYNAKVSTKRGGYPECLAQCLVLKWFWNRTQQGKRKDGKCVGRDL